MLSDKFWINRDGIQVWVATSHLKTVADRPDFFGVDENEAKNILLLHEELYGNEPEFSNKFEHCDLNLMEKLSKIKTFEQKIYDAGFVYGEYDETTLTLRSTSEYEMHSALKKLVLIEQISNLSLMIDTKTSCFAIRSFVNSNEIFYYLNENIFPRKGKYCFQKIKQNKPKFKFINILYASKTRSNSTSSKV
jgi:hypothetical protein